MSAINQISITGYGQRFPAGVSFGIGETTIFTVTCQKTDRTAIDLTGGNAVMSVSKIDGRGFAIQPPIISRQADLIAPTTAGICTFTFVSGDTIPGSGPPLTPGFYSVDIWVTDAIGNRFHVLTAGLLEITPAVGLPSNPITPLPAQAPLAQGPAGPVGPPGTVGSNADIQPLAFSAAAGASGKYADAAHQHTQGTGIATSLDTAADLRASNEHTIRTIAHIRGAIAVGDGGDGAFFWYPSATNTDDGALWIKPASVSGAGRWGRPIDHHINVKWFGAAGDGTTDDTAAIQAAIDSGPAAFAGVRIVVAPGNYRITSPLSINDTCIIEGHGNHEFYAGATLLPDAGVTAIKIINGQKTVIRDLAIKATAKDATSTTGSMTGGSLTVTLASAANFKNGQLIRIAGASSQSIPLFGVTATTSIGSNQVTFASANPDTGGLYVGQYIAIGSAFARAKIIAIVGNTLTLSTTAATSLIGSAVNYIDDLYAEIQAGGGTATLTIENTDSISVTNAEVYHADAGVLVRNRVSLEDIAIHNMQGPGVAIIASHGYTPPSNANVWHLINLQVQSSGIGILATGTDANAGMAISCSCDQNDLWAVSEDSALGNTYIALEVSGGYGYKTRDPQTNRSQFLGCYSEGGTYCTTGSGTTVIGGTMPAGLPNQFSPDGLDLKNLFKIDSTGRILSGATPTTVFNTLPNGSQAGATALKVDTNASFASTWLLQLLSAGSPALQVDGSGNIFIPFNAEILVSGQAGLQFASALHAFGNMDPSSTADKRKLGDNIYIWDQSWITRRAGVQQDISAATSITLDPANGEKIKVTLNAGTPITSVISATGLPGEKISVTIIQPAGGGASISGWDAGFVFAGGSYTPTATANKRDILEFEWDTGNSKWFEISRSMNL